MCVSCSPVLVIRSRHLEYTPVFTIVSHFLLPGLRDVEKLKTIEFEVKSLIIFALGYWPRNSDVD